jgi:hypothetical protein
MSLCSVLKGWLLRLAENHSPAEHAAPKGRGMMVDPRKKETVMKKTKMGAIWKMD